MLQQPNGEKGIEAFFKEYGLADLPHTKNGRKAILTFLFQFGPGVLECEQEALVQARIVAFKSATEKWQGKMVIYATSMVNHPRRVSYLLPKTDAELVRPRQRKFLSNGSRREIEMFKAVDGSRTIFLDYLEIVSPEGQK